MALEGSIQEFALADILQLIQLQKKSGRLVLEHAGSQVTVLFDQGQVATAAWNGVDAEPRVGEILLRAGRITPEQLARAERTASDRNLNLARALEANQAASRELIQDVLQRLVQDTVFRAFRFRDGKYSFQVIAPTYDRDLHRPIKTEFLLMEGMRRLDEWPAIERVIPGPQVILEPITVEPREAAAGTPETPMEESFGDIAADDAEENPTTEILFTMLDGQRSVAEIAGASLMDDFEVYKTCAELVRAGRARIRSAATPETESKRVLAGRRPGWITDVRSYVTGLWILVLLAAVGFAWMRPAPVPPRPSTDRLEALGDALDELAQVYYLHHQEPPPSLKTILAEQTWLGPIRIPMNLSAPVRIENGEPDAPAAIPTVAPKPEPGPGPQN